ncbi:hypothetical protein [Treponema sp.]|uniref:hypothetical protein n=1 Tax=Treponema sp. TaxID=166 RepID=UPI003F042B51
MTVILAALFFSLSFFSCATASVTAHAPAVQEQPQPDEEIAREEEENSLEQDSSEELTLPEENSSEPVLEPIEDIEGYYESEPIPVFVEAPQIIEPIEDTGEIPIEPAAEQIPPAPLPSETETEKSLPEPNSETEKSEIIEEAKNTEVPQAVPEEIASEQSISVSAEPEKKAEPLPPPEKEIAPAPEIQISAPEEKIIPPQKEEADEKPLEAPEQPEKPPVVPSRSVSIKNSQYLDIVYPGKGWIYLGEEDGKNLMRYFGRKIGEKNTSFSLRSRSEGTTVLHFYKNDALTGSPIDDYLEVEIKGTGFSNDRVTAPDYAEAVPPHVKSSAQEILPAVAAAKEITKAPETREKEIPSTEEPEIPDVQNEKEVENISSEEMLKKARQCFSEGKYKEALHYADAYMQEAGTGIDEALFLKAQIFESASAERNIKSALDSYESIVRRYPQSRHWKKASERATYLKKFYFNIR